MKEIDYLLRMDDRGIAQHDAGEALNNNIRDWLANPVHTIADQPGWGHNLSPFRFSAEGDDTEAMIEMAILSKLPADVEGLKIRSIRVIWHGIDSCEIRIEHQLGALTTPFGNKQAV